MSAVDEPGWLYRLILESLLGLKLEVDKLRFAPCLPAGWEAFKLRYRYRETVYQISVVQTLAAEAQTSVTVDGIAQPDETVPLLDDRQEHAVEVSIRRAQG